MGRKGARTVAQMWESLAEDVIPQGASEVQYQEMRRSFYAGVAGTLAYCRDGIGHPAMPEEVGAAILESWWQECVRFTNDVKEGRA